MPFPYYGSKHRLAKWIVSFFPEHDAYIEPFAGSAAVLINKQPSRFETLNDLNSDVYAFWKVLRTRYDELVRQLRLTPYSREEYLYCRDNPCDDELKKARRFYVRTCMAFNASTANVGFSATFPTKSPKAPTFVRRIDETLEEIAERIRNVEIENTDAFALIRRWSRPGALLYLDPPYLDSTRASVRDYATDNGSSDFHDRLVADLVPFRGNVVLSGYQNSIYDQLLDFGWTRTDKEVQAPTSNTQGTSGRRVESLWMNFK